MKKRNLKPKDRAHVKNAEKWLQLGRPKQALRQLQRVTHSAWQHPLTDSIVWRAAVSLA